MFVQQYFYFGLFKTCLRLNVYSSKSMKSNRLWKKRWDLVKLTSFNTLDEQFIKDATAHSWMIYIYKSKGVMWMGFKK